MKAKSRLALKISVALMAILIFALSITAIMVSASEEVVVVGEMIGINEEFSSYTIQQTVRKDDGGYVGDHQYTVFHDSSKGTIKPGYEGTPIIIYTINHPGIERIGTDSNSEIIKSMLDRGYIVVVLDYLNSAKATTTNLANSTQAFRTDLRKGKILTSGNFPSGEYHENFLAPSGYNVRIGDVFWEIDKHSTEGTLEKIVENWNSDFRATKGSRLVKWVHEDGTRKAVQNDFDGNAPVWYNSDGSNNEASGQYTYVKFTKAETITDCVDPDGSFIDMNLYINIVYPTSPENEVPVMSLANSSGYPTTSVTGADLRPHSNEFLYRGYANVVFDYLWEPMARNASWGYYDGSAGITQDHMNYALMMYNDKLVNTAAMRYLRYVSLSGGDTYNFDLDAFGVYGNSKGGWFSYLGEKILQSELVDASKYSTTEALEIALSDALAALIPDRYYNGHHGETRYQVGAGEITKDGFTIKAGTVQPWLTYEGKEILSGCQLTNACNGSQEEDITAGHSPIFISGNMTDTYNAAYSYSVNIHNICKNLNIPLLHFEVPIGHTLTSGMDMNYNVDTYDAFFKYVGYYLQGYAIDVAYVSPMPEAGEVKVTDKIKIGFTGVATLAEVSKITLTAGDVTVTGTWKSSYGGTVWTFTPDALTGSTEYTLTVPATFTGDNGKQMGKVYTESFITEYDNATEAAASGNYYTLTAPSMTSGNGFVFRFRVTNDAANVANLYAVSAVGETSGELLGSVNLRGAGSYEIDISDYIAANSGKAVVLYLTGAKAAGTTTVTSNNFDAATLDTNTFSKGGKAETLTAQTIDGKTAVGVYIKTPTAKDVSVYYDNVTTAFTYKYIVGNSAPKTEDLGRRYTISFDVYDTINRVVKVNLNSMTKRVDYGTIDYDNVYFNVRTKANAWTHVEFTYEVYEADYGFPAAIGSQSLSISLSPSGNTNKIAYFDNLLVTETVTDITVSSACVAEKNDGTGAYNAPVSTSPFAVYNGDSKIGDYAGWAAALGAYKSGYTIKLQRDYTLTDSDLSNKISSFATVNLDLGTYAITCANTKNSLLWMRATTDTDTVVNVSGGAIRLERTALVSYEDASSAGMGKAFELNFSNTYFGFAYNAWTTEIISDTDAVADIEISSNFTFNDCTFDFDETSHAKDASIIFPAPLSTCLLDLSYTVIGGTIKLSSQRWISIHDSAQLVDFAKTANGYTTLVMPESITKEVTGSYLMTDGYANYVKTSTASNMATYSLVRGDNSTRYGVIPEAYANTQTYPFLVFSDGNCVGAYSTWNKLTAALATIATEAKSEYQVLLTRDFTNTDDSADGNALTKIKGTVVFDLGGNKLTRAKPMLDLYTNKDSQGFTTTFIFKNGYMLSTGSAFGDSQCAATVTQEKSFVLTFEGITFGFSDGTTGGTLMWLVWNNSRETVKCKTELNFVGCTFDLRGVTKSTKLFDFKDGYDDFDFTANIKGGTILADDKANITFSTVNSGSDTVNMMKGTDGKYPTLKLSSASGAPITDSFNCDDGKQRCFTLIDGSDTDYELTINPLATPYGTISSTYADAEKYPFAVFFDGALVGGYTHFANTVDSDANNDAKDALQYAKAKVHGAAGAGKTVYIVLRRNYVADYLGSTESYNNISQIGGTLVIDLNGYSFTAGSKTMLACTGKATSSVIHDSRIVIKNGTINLSPSSSLIALDSTAGVTSPKNFFFEFDNVKLVASANTKSNPIMTTSTGKGTANVIANATFTGCEFNYSAVATSHTIFNVKNDTDNIACTVNIIGGKIVSSKAGMDKITFANTSSNDSVTFVKDENGKYTYMEYPSSNTPSAKQFPTDAGNLYFVETADDGTTSTYELMSLATPYGTPTATNITDNPKYLSVVDYPFFVFKNGTFQTASTTWKNAVTAAKNLVKDAGCEDETVEIVMRRNYDVTKAAADNGNNFNTARGTIVADLSGYTLKAVDTYIIDIYINYSTTSILNFESSILIKNGSFVNMRSDYTSIGLGHTNTAASGYSVKKINFSFENVTFKSPSKPIIEDFGHTAATGLKIDLNCTNCTFDFTGSAKDLVLFKLATKQSNVISNVRINGGTLIASALANYKLYTINTAEDSALLGKNANGNYLSVMQLTDSAAPTTAFKNLSGNALAWATDTTEGNYTTYLLGDPIETPYGNIPFTYQSTELYPFAVFDEKGNFIKISGSFYGANSSSSAIHYAKDYMAANTWNGTSYGSAPRAAFILLRRDYTLASNETYNNLAQIQGVITIDLAGYTLSAANDNVMFPADIKPWTVTGDQPIFPTNFVLINGNITIKNQPLIKYSPWTGSSNIDVSDKEFDFLFENVNFKVTGSAKTFMATHSVNSQTPDAQGNPELIFKECTFDITGAASGITLFNLGSENVHCTVKVLGGEIIADDAFTMYSKPDTTNGTIVFGKTDDGNYTALTLPVASAAPAEEYPIEGGTASFVKISDGIETSTYRLRDTKLADVDFTPKMSLTLDRDLIFNIYVPAKSLVKFTLNGVDYTNLDDIEELIETVDEADYYRVQIPVSAKNATGAIILRATVDVGEGKSASATFSFDIVKYATEVLKGDNTVENQLMLDVLSYVRAAYVYFEMSGNDEAIARIDEILGDNYDAENAPATEGSATAPTEGLFSATFVLDATPAIRFYLADGADATAYRFYANGVMLATDCATEDGRTYIDIDVYAYRMCETVTYTINGTEAGSFHIRCYYEWAAEQNNDALTSVVARFWKYAQSARDYRNSVIGG